VLSVRAIGPGGAPVSDHEIRLTERGNDQTAIGEYNGLVFEVNRSLLRNLEGDMTRKPEGSSSGSSGSSIGSSGAP
jgi:hypothetical protein